ncbi:MAG: CPBP family intramembrane glutamic endopeptidase [Planctomycetota bacterium]
MLETAVIPTLGQAASAEVGGLSYWLSIAFWAGAVAVLVGVLYLAGAFRGSVLKRGPTRELELAPADLAIGLGVVAFIVVGKLSSFGKVVVPAAAVELAFLFGAGFFVLKAALSEAGGRRSGLIPRRPGRDLVYTAAGLPIGFGLVFALLALINGVATLAGFPSPALNHESLRELVRDPTVSAVLELIVSAVIVAPLLEEVLFRGLLQTWLLDVLGRDRRWLTVTVAAAAFASVHVGLVSWHGLPGLFVLGLVLGWLYEKTGSLLPPVLVHAGFNAANIGYVLWVLGP